VNQVVARASTALNHVRSFHLHESEIDHSGRRITFDADFVIPGHVAFRESVGNEAFSVRLLDGYNYLNGNAAFWRSQGSSSALAKRWTREPASATPEFEQFRQLATPQYSVAVSPEPTTMTSSSPPRAAKPSTASQRSSCTTRGLSPAAKPASSSWPPMDHLYQSA
jgi:hypothetical protein